MGMLKIEASGSFNITSKTFSAMKNGHAQAVAEAIKFLSEIIKSTTINSSLRDRISIGSSGIKEQKRMIGDRMKKINAYREGIMKRNKEVKFAAENLSKKVKELTK